MPVPAKQVFLTQGISQGSEESVPLLSPSELSARWRRFKLVCDLDPNPDEECTGDQLIGTDVLFKRDVTPYVVFGEWKPYHHSLRNTGLQLHVGCVLKSLELCGLSVTHAWLECYRPLLLGFGAVGLGPVSDYGRLVPTYAERYGASTWFLPYQCDVRCQLEQREWLRDQFEWDNRSAAARGQSLSVPFDPARPWTRSGRRRQRTTDIGTVIL